MLLWLEAELAPEEAPSKEVSADEGESPAEAEAPADEAAPVDEAAIDEAAPPAEEPAADAAAPPADEVVAGETEAETGEAPVAEMAEETAEEMEEPAPETPKDRFAALVLPFLTLQPQGGVILLHDYGGHPDWPGVVGALRRGLPDHGWATLSIEYPSVIAKRERRVRQAVKRIEAALRFYNQRQLYNVVLVAHGEGALAATTYLADNAKAGIAGFVAVGMETPPSPLGGLLLLEGLYMPMLELYGEQDSAAVVAGARERQQAVLRGGNEKYRQQPIAGADHFFHATETDLVELVRRWLKRYAAGMEINLGSSEGRSLRKSLSLIEPAAEAEEGATPPVDVELEDAP